MTLQLLQACVGNIPNHSIPAIDQINELQNTLQQGSPVIYEHTQRSRLNILHLFAYIPSEHDLSQELSSILEKCPEAAKAADCDGKTPIHHAILRRKHHAMNQEMYDVLLARSPLIVVHKAIQAPTTMRWKDLKVLVEAKTNALTEDDKDNGMFPFMLAATRCKDDHPDGRLGSLSNVYLLLRMKPAVLKEFSDTPSTTQDDVGIERNRKRSRTS